MHMPANPVPPPPPIPAEVLLGAYRLGLFPMADHRDDPEIFWVEPRQRAIIPLESFRPSRSLRRTIRSDRFEVTCDRDFAAVIAACAAPREEHAESWISRRVEDSYLALHAAGHAHSIECRRGGVLVGGLYGVAFDRVFCGESMFSREADASKVALAWLVAAMRRAGYLVLDCQFMTEHLATLGAIALPQTEYLERITAARGAPEGSIPDAVRFYASSSASDSESDAPSSPGNSIAQSFTQTS